MKFGGGLQVRREDGEDLAPEGTGCWGCAVCTAVHERQDLVVNAHFNR